MTRDEVDLGLVVGAATSGTTLMRVLLDAHPEIGCPAEAGVPALMSHMAGAWLATEADVDESAANVDTREAAPAGSVQAQTSRPGAVPVPTGLPADARTWIRDTVQQLMRRYVARGQKRIYVDKSLDSVHHLELVGELFPEVKCVLMFRHIMDTIASGLEASPWGFQAYGYVPYVQVSPYNLVAALASYWLDHVTAALAWAETHSKVCCRVKYEDLVLSPDETVASVCSFFGVAKDLSILQRSFEGPTARGPGDYKIVHTTAVHAQSIGRGKRVPVTLIPTPLLEAVNAKLTQLGYEELDVSWNATERVTHTRAESIWSERLRGVMDAVDFKGQRLLRLRGVAFAIVAEDDRTLRWVIDTDAKSVAQGEGDVDWVVTGTAEDLVLMLAKEENLGVLVRTGRIRHLAPNHSELSTDLVTTLNEMVHLLGSESSRG